MDKLIITAAICGAEVTKENNPAVPYTVDEIVREAKSAYDAGAAIIHLHVRYDDGTPTQSKERFKECVDAIKKVCPDVIMCLSTGGATGMTAEERLQPVELRPELASLDCGSCNFGGELFVNSEDMIVEFAKKMDEYGVTPEVELLDKGFLDTAMRLRRQGILKSPTHFYIGLNIPGAMGGTPRDLMFLVESLPKDCTWGVTGIGRAAFPMATMAILLGGHVRVGLEDNLYLAKGVLAKSNGELVEKVVRIAKELGREIATPAEARAILGLN
ncbi:MAG: 3-keto-5-aminohexanoate cleavage protein [Eubacteriales bacterium]|nr:3-keto-5-aminohexanoate cleavage protein [Eubacteriales bacterium]